MLKMQEANQRSQELDQQLKIVEQQIGELESFKGAIETIEGTKENEILASIGKGVYIKSEMKEKELFVDVGSGIFVKKKLPETKNVAEEQVKKLHEMRIQLTLELTTLNSELETLISKAQEKQPI
jgi:prefoldin alpha subunit